MEYKKKRANYKDKHCGIVFGSDCYEIVKYDRDVNKGKVSITIKGVGDYGGVKTVVFKIKRKVFCSGKSNSEY